MTHIFYLMGKSASGKDSLYERLMGDPSLAFIPLIPWTTRPMRDGETEGAEYHFTDEEGLKKLQEEGRVIELRSYHTECGIWKYFTVAGDSQQGSGRDILGIGTLESFQKIREYYGRKRVIPLYIEVEDGIRLQRALKREMKPGNHRYEEMCRRFLADQQDFSQERLQAAGILERFDNSGQFEDCLKKVRSRILEVREGI